MWIIHTYKSISLILKRKHIDKIDFRILSNNVSPTQYHFQITLSENWQLSFNVFMSILRNEVILQQRPWCQKMVAIDG